MKTRDTMCSQEATRDPIFLFQVKTFILKEVPYGYHFDDDYLIVKDDTDQNEEPEILTWEELEDMDCATHYWDTECVFYSREEGEDYGNRCNYNYPNGWRVYCVCAEGILTKILKKYGDKETQLRQVTPVEKDWPERNGMDHFHGPQ